MQHSLTPSQRNLITPDAMGYADTLAHRFFHRGIELSDLRQEAYYGLCLAALHYDASKGVAFKTFAHFYVMRTLVDAFNTYQNMLNIPRSERPYVHLLSLDLVLSDGGDTGAEYLDDDDTPATCDIADVASDTPPPPDITAMLNVLTPRERRAIQCLFGIDRPQLSRKDTARQLKVTPERIRILYNKALAKMSLSESTE